MSMRYEGREEKPGEYEGCSYDHTQEPAGGRRARVSSRLDQVATMSRIEGMTTMREHR
jgi:hypothetical protein